MVDLSEANKLTVSETYPNVSPSNLFRYWIEPKLLTQWWPQQAEVDSRVGGEYHLAWPGMDWHLRGKYLDIEPGQRFHFTWRWDHEPDTPTRYVDVRFLNAEKGTELTLMHSEYGENDQEERQGHLDGWQHFLAKLGEASNVSK